MAIFVLTCALRPLQGFSQIVVSPCRVAEHAITSGVEDNDLYQLLRREKVKTSCRMMTCQPANQK